MKAHFRFEFAFPHQYEVKVLEQAPPVHPLEKLHHFPLELEEGDRAGAYVRVIPEHGPAWRGFFALGFDTPQAINCVSSCPNAHQLCVIAGGYAYVVNAADPAQWLQIEQRPVTQSLSLTRQGLLLFIGFTSITALGAAGVAWTTGKLSWEGVRTAEIGAQELHGFGWDAISDKEVAFTVDLATGKHTGGARPTRRPGDLE
jgi:hypothetical protein